MKKVSVICFTYAGARMALRIESFFRRRGMEPESWCRKEETSLLDRTAVRILLGSLHEWTGEHFEECYALVFVGAAGIAVRCIAPYLRSKAQDPAVLCVDEKGRFVIPLVSGHLGGANELARSLADSLGAVPVITTATDLNDRFAVDVFAREQNLHISSLQMAKRISAVLLDGEMVGFCSDFPVEGPLPWGLFAVNEKGEASEPGDGILRGGAAGSHSLPVSGREGPEGSGLWIHITVSSAEIPGCLRLVPKAVSIGAGCRKNKDPAQMEEFLLQFLKQHAIDFHAVEKLCSIDCKAGEEAFLAFSGKYGIPFETFSAEELGRCPGNFSGSAFVEQTAGVDNVCERSAVCGCGYGELIAGKYAGDGMTAAAALRRRTIYF